jgi:hypothetical protein
MSNTTNPNHLLEVLENTTKNLAEWVERKKSNDLASAQAAHEQAASRTEATNTDEQ